ncbi:MAG: PIN domain-containing protein [bacterium]|nr:PIN domain-containing protein [bacterium]
MRTKSKLLDANIIIRLLTGDSSKQAEAVASLLKNARPNELELPDVVLAEIVWVLQSYYSLNKPAIIASLRALAETKSIKLNRELFGLVISIYQANNISYIDAYVAARSKIENKILYTFDQQLRKIAGSNGKTPR